MTNSKDSEKIPPLVSVIIPVKNGATYLGEALDSVARQTYEPLDVIVIDDGSTDNTAQIVDTFFSNSTLSWRYVFQENQGLAAARNHGLKLAQGEFITYLAHDDIWTPDKLTHQINYLIAHPEIQYTVCRIKFFLEPGHEIPTGFRPELLQQEPAAYIPETLAARHHLFEQIGQFDLTLSPSDDVDWFARVFDAGILGYVAPQVLLHKRVHNANISLNIPDSNTLLLETVRRSMLRKRQKGMSGTSS